MKKIFGILLLILIVVIGYLGFSGLFSGIDIHENRVGPYTYVYQNHIGPYDKVGPLMDEVYKKLLDSGIETYKGIGVYYDDPSVIDEDKLRSDVGRILEEREIFNLEDIKKKFNVRKLDKKSYVVAQHPYRNQISIMLGIMKVYPGLTKYFEKNNLKMGKVIEIYDFPNKKITYLAEFSQ